MRTTPADRDHPRTEPSRRSWLVRVPPLAKESRPRAPRSGARLRTRGGRRRSGRMRSRTLVGKGTRWRGRDDEPVAVRRRHREADRGPLRDSRCCASPRAGSATNAQVEVSAFRPAPSVSSGRRQAWDAARRFAGQGSWNSCAPLRVSAAARRPRDRGTHHLSETITMGASRATTGRATRPARRAGWRRWFGTRAARKCAAPSARSRGWRTWLRCAPRGASLRR